MPATRPIFRAAAFVSSAAVASTLCALLCTAPLAAQTAPPTLVVQITVDQLRPDYLDRWASQFTGGLARLLKQGAFFTNASHDHEIGRASCRERV